MMPSTTLHRLFVSWLIVLTAIGGCVANPGPVNEETPAGLFSSTVPAVHRSTGEALEASKYPGFLPSFVQAFVGNNRGAGEPTLGVGPDGAIYYVSTSFRDPTFPKVYRSQDEGATWRDVTPKAAGPIEEPMVSGDPFLHVDPKTGRIFVYHQQTRIVCGNWAISDRGGDAWTTWNTCRDTSYGDHPSIATATPRNAKPSNYPHVVYFCASIGDESACRVSLDGGLTYGAPVTAIEACTQSDGERAFPSMGHVKGGPDGTVYIGKLACGAARIGVTRDDGKTWKTVIVDTTAWPAPRPHAVLDHEANIAVDAAGTVYYAFVGTDDVPRLSVSNDGGEHWRTPIPVAPPFVSATNFPTIVAGDPGRIAYFYYGTTIPGGFRAANISEAEWNGYVTFTLNADEEDPVFATVQVNPANDPLKRGDCSNRCALRNGPLGEDDPVGYGFLQDGVYDFVDMDLDPRTGLVRIALVDVCTGPCADRTGSPESGAALAAVGVQTTGTPLLEAPGENG